MRSEGPGQVSHEKDTLWRTFPSDSSAFPLHASRGHAYDLYLRYRFQRETEAHFTVVVSPYWWTTTWFILLGIVAVVTTCALLLFEAYRGRKRRQLARQEEQRRTAIQSLQSVQAQLNPHFIFNALTSIQGLVNRGDIDGANQYLSTFSSLMRNTLTQHERVQGTLSQELRSMETYLQLEQLRFHFQFRIDTNLPADTIEVPHLLFQPIVENAVKHGVSSLRENGLITLSAYARAEDLVVEVTDNGLGCHPAEPDNSGSFGLRLTTDRIRHLNQLNAAASIGLFYTAGRRATTFTFIFNRWLS